MNIAPFLDVASVQGANEAFDVVVWDAHSGWVVVFGSGSELVGVKN
jgi:hypothetical protein